MKQEGGYREIDKEQGSKSSPPSDEITYRDAIKQVLWKAAPFSFAQIALMAGDLAMVYVLAKVDPDHLAASALISSVQSLFFSSFAAVLKGVNIQVGEEKGALQINQSKLADIGLVYRESLILTVILSIPLMIASPFIGNILVAFGQNQFLSDIAQHYFSCRLWGTFFLLGLQTNIQFMLGNDEKSYAAMAFSILEAVLSAFTGYLFTLGPGIFPRGEEYGLGHAAAGTSCFVFLVSSLFILCYKEYATYELLSLNFSGGWAKLREIAAHGFSIALQESGEQVGLGLSGIVVGKLGGMYLAAQQAAMLWVWLFLTPATATAEALGSLIAEKRTAGQKETIKRLGIVALICSEALSLLGLVIFSVLANPLSRLTLDPKEADTEQIISMAKSLFIIQGVGLLVDSPRQVSIGLLRGLKDRWTPNIQAFVTSGIAVAFGALLAFPVNLKMDGMYIARDIAVFAGLVILLKRWFVKSSQDPSENEDDQTCNSCFTNLKDRIFSYRRLAPESDDASASKASTEVPQSRQSFAFAKSGDQTKSYGTRTKKNQQPAPSSGPDPEKALGFLS